jgi:hypothetical protein
MAYISQDCSIRISANPDPRLFGAQCLNTADVASMTELAEDILTNLEHASSYAFSMQVFHGRHLGLTFAGLDMRAPRQEHVELASLFMDMVEQYNWLNPNNPMDRRFWLCQVTSVPAEDAPRIRSTARVSTAENHRCPLADHPVLFVALL